MNAVRLFLHLEVRRLVCLNRQKPVDRIGPVAGEYKTDEFSKI